MNLTTDMQKKGNFKSRRTKYRRPTALSGGVLYPNHIGALHRMRDGRCYRVVEAGLLTQRGMLRRCDAHGQLIPRLRLSKKLRRLMRAQLFRPGTGADAVGEDKDGKDPKDPKD